MKNQNIRCSIVRGGTSKGVIFDGRQLPHDSRLRNEIILSLFGSPDIRQINGLGGADPLTSKVVLVYPASEPDVDVDYFSGEVGIHEALVNFSIMCGNMASGVALYAYSEGMVRGDGKQVVVRIRNVNTGKRLSASFNIENGRPVVSDSGIIDGVKGAGTKVELSFLNPQGAVTGQLLPSNNAVDTLALPLGAVDVSIVDSGTLYAFVHAHSLGLNGDEIPHEIDSNEMVREKVESIRSSVAKLISARMGTTYIARQVKVAIVNPQSGIDGADVISRVINKYKTHKAYPVSGAICLSAALLIPGTIVHKVNNSGEGVQEIKIAHPRGIIKTVNIVSNSDVINIHSSTIARSARILMSGVSEVFY